MAMKPVIAPEPNPPPAELRAPADVQRLWFTLSQQPFSFLVVMPAHKGGEVTALTQQLAEVGTRHRGTAVRFLNAQNVEVGGTSHVILEATNGNAPGGATLVAVDSPLANPASIPLARAADGVILVVELGNTDVASAKQTVEAVGRERIFGTVTVSSGLVP